VNSLDYFDHVLQSAFHVFTQFFLIRVKTHVLFFNSNVEEASLALLLHLFEEDVHRLVVYAHESLDHDVVD
jgi:hypothetical protein